MVRNRYKRKENEWSSTELLTVVDYKQMEIARIQFSSFGIRKQNEEETVRTKWCSLGCLRIPSSFHLAQGFAPRMKKEYYFVLQLNVETVVYYNDRENTFPKLRRQWISATWRKSS